MTDGATTSTASTTTVTASGTSSSTGSTTSGTTTEATTDGTGTTGAGACDFETVTCELADQGKRPPMDCGFVRIADDAAAWQAAHDCFRMAVQNQRQAKVLWEAQAIDSIFHGAYVAQVGAVYSISRIDHEVFGGATNATRRACTGISTAPGCMVAPGSLCIDCLGGAAPEPFCSR